MDERATDLRDYDDSRGRVMRLRRTAYDGRLLQEHVRLLKATKELWRRRRHFASGSHASCCPLTGRHTHNRLPSPTTTDSAFIRAMADRGCCAQKYVVSTDRSGDIHVHVQLFLLRILLPPPLPGASEGANSLSAYAARVLSVRLTSKLSHIIIQSLIGSDGDSLVLPPTLGSWLVSSIRVRVALNSTKSSREDSLIGFLFGSADSSLVDFVNCPAMAEIKERSCFIHVDVPGHEENSPDLPESYPFPSLQTLGEDLVTVLDFLRVRYAVGLGEGAGANVLARCGLAHPARLLGLVLVNCTASTSSVADAFRSRFSRWRGADISHSEEDFLIYHKFGHQIPGEGERERTLSEYRSRLRGNLNPHNLKQYVRAFINRKDLVLRGCRPDLLLVTGTRSPYASVVEKMYRDLDKEKVTILKVDNAGDVLTEAPAKVAVSLLLFCQGQGLLTSLPPPGVERRMSRNISMEEYDTPNIRRLSLTPAAPATAANTTP
ncbi:Uncharacterized protein ZK1073.1 [Papilio machaon]|uniref:Uncharacterized protein ZK1073.1 n=1 Tax=Papilio machaon TaxID=76193 RepID=A0A194RE36_PAPMA|nr:Uncharacterized protein ZK1073.1 [Papilio machaon]